MEKERLDLKVIQRQTRLDEANALRISYKRRNRLGRFVYNMKHLILWLKMWINK